MNTRSHPGIGQLSAATAIVLGALVVGTAGVVSAQAKPMSRKTFAQQLVETTQRNHPDITELGISATTARGCRGIASTDKTDIGEKCEADDIKPMQTGKPSVAKESDGYDVALLLHDAGGKVIGVIGLEYKLAAGETVASVTTSAQKIVAEIEPQIKSKAALFQPAK